MAILAAIEVEDDGSLKIKNFRDALTDLGKGGEEAGAGLEKIEPPARKGKDALADLQLQAIAAATVFGLLGDAAFRLVRESADLAGQVQVLNTSMVAVAKTTGNSSFELQKQSQTIQALGITAREANNAVIQFATANLELEKAAKLARVAQDLAVVAGRNSSDTYGILVRAIQQTNVRLLDQAGVITTQTRIQEKWSQTTGKNVKDMTSLDLQTAILNEILDQGARRAGAYEAAMSDASKQIGSFARVQENAQVAMGKTFLPLMLTLVTVISSMVDSFTQADPILHKFTAAILAAAGAMAVFTAAVVSLKVLQLGLIFAGISAPVLAAVAAIGLLTAAIVLFTSSGKIMTEEMLQQAAGTQATIDKFDSLLPKYEALAAKTNKTAEEQEEYNRAAASLAKIAPDAVRGIDATTNAYILNSGALRENRAALENVLQAQLASARLEFQKREEELATATRELNEAQKERQATIQRVTAAGLDLNTMQAGANQLNMVANQFSRISIDSNVRLAGQLGRTADALKDTSTNYNTVLAAYNKEKQLLDELDPKRKAALDAARQATAADLAREAASQQAAEERRKQAEQDRKYYADQLAQITGVSDKERTRFSILNDALKTAGVGTEEYNRLIIRNKSLVEQASEATTGTLRGLDAVTKAVEDLKNANLAVEMQKWIDKAAQIEAQVGEALKNTFEGFTNDVAKALDESNKKIVDFAQTAATSIASQDLALREKRIAIKQSETDKLIAQNNKYYQDLILKNQTAIDNLNQFKAAEIKRIDDLAAKRKQEIDDIIAKAALKFNIEAETGRKIDQLRAALAAGDVARAEDIKARLIANLNAMGDAEKARIDEATANAKAAQAEQFGILDETVVKYEEQNRQIQQQNEETNAEIVRQHSDTFKIVKGVWDAIAGSVSDSLMGMIKGTMSWKEAILNVWQSIQKSVFGIIEGMVKKWIDGMMKMKDSSTGVGSGMSRVGGGLAVGAAGFGAGQMVGGLTSNRAVGAAGGAAAGAATGAMIGTFVLPGIGTGVGAGIGAIAGALGGLFGSNKKKKEQEEEIRGAREELLKTFGTVEALKKVANEAGVNFDKLWNTKKPQEYQAEVEKLNKHLAEQAKIAEEAAARWAGVEKVLDAVNRRSAILANGFKNSTDEIEKLQESMAKMDKTSEEFTKAEAELKKLQATAKETAASSQEDFTALGTYVTAAFSVALKEGGNLNEVLAELEPSFKVLEDGVKEFGMQGSNAITALLQMREIVTANKDVFDAIQANVDMLEGFQAAGVQTSELYQTIGADIGRQWQELADRGVDTNKAMALLQPTLQTLWEHQQKFGDITDETTLALLAQAEQQGVVGAHMKDVNQQILDVLLAIGEVLGAKIPEALAQAGQATAESAQKQVSSLQVIRDRQILLIDETAEYEQQMYTTGQSVGKQLSDVEGAVAAVTDATSDMSENVLDSRDAFGDWADYAVEKAEEVQDAIDGVSYGHSPGGIKDIPILLMEAKSAMTDFAGSAMSDAGAVEESMKNMAPTEFVSTIDEVKVRQAELGEIIKVNTDAINQQETAQQDAANKMLAGTKKNLDELIDMSNTLGSELPAAVNQFEAVFTNSAETQRRLEEQLIQQQQEMAQKVEEVAGAHTEASPVINETWSQAQDGLDEVAGAGDNVNSMLDDSIDSFRDWAEEAIDAAEEVQDAIDGISMGHSPGGIKEIPLKLAEARKAMHDFSTAVRDDAGRVESDISGLSGPDLGGAVSIPSPGISDTRGDRGGDAIVQALNEMKGSIGGKTEIKFEVNTPIATVDTLRQIVYDEIGPAFLAMVEQNKAGSKTRLAKALGTETSG